MKINKKEVKKIIDDILDRGANGEVELEVTKNKNGEIKNHIQGDVYALLFVIWELEKTIKKQLNFDDGFIEIIKDIKNEYTTAEVTKYEYKEINKDV